jgi:hypothetical protein
MLTAGLLPRLLRLPPRRKFLLLRASVALVAASAAVALLPFRKAIVFGSVPVGRRTKVSVEEWMWAIEAAAPRLPCRTMCIEKGLALQRLLRGSGHDAILHYGGRHDRDTHALEAHVWVTLGAQTLIGEDAAPDFAELATFP